MKSKRIIFLDRDGVVNYNPIRYDYVKKHSEFRFLPGARKAIRMLTETGLDVVIISNQAGVGRGLFTKKDLKGIDDKMLRGLHASGGKLKKIYYCIHPPDAGCDCRKPNTGMFKKAVSRIRIDHKNSFYVGDTERDTVAGSRFGVKTVAVLSGYAKKKDIKKWQIQPDFIADDLLAAVQNIILKSVPKIKKKKGLSPLI